MAYATKSFLGFFFVLFLQNLVECEPPQVPCYFIFGDTFAENGNNNPLNTTAKVNYPPYGIDFPAGPTGRFCNGRTGVDIIAELLGFSHFIPPFATASGSEILEGVNYASAASGIREESGTQFGENLSLDKQLQNHNITITSLGKILGSEAEATNLLRKCLYTVEMGSDDYLNNYFFTQFFNTSRQYSPQQYKDILATQYTQQLEKLYYAGARKIALFGVPPLGCSPNAIALHGNNGQCAEQINSAIQLFNEKLISIVDELNGRLSSSQFIYVNIYDISQSYLNETRIRVIDAACCPLAPDFFCSAGQSPCENRSEYFFFDDFHPTEIANIFTYNRAYNASKSSDAYPFDISTLAKL